MIVAGLKSGPFARVQDNPVQLRIAEPREIANALSRVGLATQLNPLLKDCRKRLRACHSERSEESKLLMAKRNEMFRFAQHDSRGGFSATC
jgi:hypothetical protein